MESETPASPHLTVQELTAYQERRVPPEQLFALAAHLHQCATCAAQLQRESLLTRATQQWQRELSTALDDPCDFLLWEQKAAYADSNLQGEEKYWVETHLEICPECQSEIQAYQMLHTQMQNTEMVALSRKPNWLARWQATWARPQLRWSLQLGATAALVGLSIWLTTMYWQAKTRQLTQQITQLTAENTRTRQELTKVAELEQSFARRQTSPPVGQENLATTRNSSRIILTDGQQPVALNQAGQITGLPIPPGYETAIHLALRQQQLLRPAILKGLTGPDGTLMGAGQKQPDFALLSPFKKIVATQQPTFRWYPLSDATNYTVTLYDENFKEVARSEKLTTTKWTTPQPLPRGKVYLWQVRALKEEKEIIAPPPNAPDAKFGILGQAQQEEMEQLLKQAADSHLVKGIIYTNYGLLEEAQQEFQLLANANPNSAVARSLLQQSNRLR